MRIKLTQQQFHSLLRGFSLNFDTISISVDINKTNLNDVVDIYEEVTDQHYCVNGCGLCE